MKVPRPLCFLFFLGTAAVSLAAQQIDADPKQFEIILAKAEKGDAQSQFDAGAAYYFGRFGLQTNEMEAVKWFRKSAEQNNPNAQCNLGFCYENGHGVPKDEVEALRWYRKAAEQDFPTGEHNLGASYEAGLGTPRNPVEAAKWYRKAAEQGHSSSQYGLGFCYANGVGVPKDYVEGYKWFNLASSHGDSEEGFVDAKKVLV